MRILRTALAATATALITGLIAAPTAAHAEEPAQVGPAASLTASDFTLPGDGKCATQYGTLDVTVPADYTWSLDAPYLTAPGSGPKPTVTDTRKHTGSSTLQVPLASFCGTEPTGTYNYQAQVDAFAPSGDSWALVVVASFKVNAPAAVPAPATSRFVAVSKTRHGHIYRVQSTLIADNVPLTRHKVTVQRRTAPGTWHTIRTTWTTANGRAVVRVSAGKAVRFTYAGDTASTGTKSRIVKVNRTR